MKTPPGNDGVQLWWPGRWAIRSKIAPRARWVMAKSGPAKYSASASLQGYIYQCRYALLLMLRRIRTSPTAKVAVEKFDDVSFETGGTPKDLVQTKYHGTPGNLSDTSEDWWKTLRIWSEGVR